MAHIDIFLESHYDVKITVKSVNFGHKTKNLIFGTRIYYGFKKLIWISRFNFALEQCNGLMVAITLEGWSEDMS